MSSYSISLDSDGVRALLKSQEVLDTCDEVGKKVANRADGSYEVSSQVHNRAVTRVMTADSKTFYRNLNGNYLLKALK